MTDLEPTVLKLVHSTQSAIPFDLAFWERLAHGLFLTPESLGDLVGGLAREGILLGWGGELNPDLAEACEALLVGSEPPAGAHVRWSGRTASGPACSVVSLGEGRPPGWRSERCVKCWGRLRPEVRAGIDLLAPDTDRTSRTGGGERPRLMLGSSLEAQLAQALLRVRALRPPVTPWGELAGELGVSEGSVVVAAKRLVVARVFRRICFRFSAAGLGFGGCALAAWGMGSGEELAGAADGLAGLAGVADVFMRQPDAKTGGNLTCLLLGRDPGSGVDAARRLGEQWGIPPLRVDEIDLA